jgi:hypothetical protein
MSFASKQELRSLSNDGIADSDFIAKLKVYLRT